MRGRAATADFSGPPFIDSVTAGRYSIVHPLNRRPTCAGKAVHQESGFRQEKPRCQPAYPGKVAVLFKKGRCGQPAKETGIG
jgi:hypothetical protein